MSRADLKGVLFLCLLSVATAAAYNQFSPNGIAWIGQWDASKGVTRATSKTDDSSASLEIHDIETISAIIETESRLVIDARSKESFLQGRLPGAVSYPAERMDELIQDILMTIPPDQPILVYCSSIECTDAHTMAQQLIIMNYSDVKIFSGGFQAWEEAGQKIEKNES